MTNIDNISAPSQDAIDARNKDFYGRFPYPWSLQTFPLIADPQCGTVFLNQDLGDWTHRRIPHNPRIWVVGCGTNQAVLTALRFPEAEVLGTDLSTPSLAISQEAASRLGIQNLRLEEQSLNTSRFQDEFDYIICTGVIHHNAHPAITLRKLSAALKRDGILELMVYNSFHMLLATAYQKFIHLLFPGEAALDLDSQLLLTKALIDTFPADRIASSNICLYFSNGYPLPWFQEGGEKADQDTLQMTTILCTVRHVKPLQRQMFCEAMRHTFFHRL